MQHVRQHLTWPIIVGGCYRTGTSLLRRILDSHSRIHCGPEIKFFNDFYGTYLKDPLTHARFFTTIRTLGLDDDTLLELFGTALLRSHDIAAERQGKSRWANKTPENVLFLEQWLRLLDGQFHFIHCVRNPLDTIASLKESGFAFSVPETFDEQIQLYRKFVAEGVRFEREQSAISIRVRYEDLVTHPERILVRLMDFVGEEFEPQMIAFNAKEHQRGLEDPKVRFTHRIHRDSLGRGMTLLTREEIETVGVHCSDLFGLLGYETPRTR